MGVMNEFDQLTKLEIVVAAEKIKAEYKWV